MMADTSIDQRLLKMKSYVISKPGLPPVLYSMKLLSDNVPGIAASKVSTRVAETARVSAHLHAVPHLRTGCPSLSLKVSQLITRCLSFLLAGIASCKGIRLGNRFSETLFSYKRKLLHPGLL